MTLNTKKTISALYISFLIALFCGLINHFNGWEFILMLLMGIGMIVLSILGFILSIISLIFFYISIKYCFLVLIGKDVKFWDLFIG